MKFKNAQHFVAVDVHRLSVSDITLDSWYRYLSRGNYPKLIQRDVTPYIGPTNVYKDMAFNLWHLWQGKARGLLRVAAKFVRNRAKGNARYQPHFGRYGSNPVDKIGCISYEIEDCKSLQVDRSCSGQCSW